MSVDKTQPIAEGSRPNWDLPDILDIEIRRVSFEPPKLRHSKSTLAGYKEAIEFLVKTSGPIPARAMGPALFIDDVQVIESMKIDNNLYRFLAFDPKRLKSGASISLGWIGTPKEQLRKTMFRYKENH